MPRSVMREEMMAKAAENMDSAREAIQALQTPGDENEARGKGYLACAALWLNAVAIEDGREAGVGGQA